MIITKKQSLVLGFFLMVLYSCTSTNETEQIEKQSANISADTSQRTLSDNQAVTPDSIISESVYDMKINGKKWHDVELNGDPDTALTLFVYRILFTNEKDEMNDCVIRANLFEATAKVKKIFPVLFEKEFSKTDINYLIDSLNKASYYYSKGVVDQEINEYGESEGPCFDLYTITKKSFED